MKGKGKRKVLITLLATILTTVLLIGPIQMAVATPPSPGSIAVWGDGSFGQLTDTPVGNDFTAISAGAGHSLALRSDGSLEGWGGVGVLEPYGNIGFGQADVPEGNDFTAMSAGGWHSLALRSDGSIEAWGCDVNFYNQSVTTGQVSETPEGNDFTAVSAGAFHSLALKEDGTIVGWGSNTLANSGFYVGQATPPSGNDYVAIAAGSWHSLALRSDGSIVGWGWNGSGQATPPSGNNYVAIAAGGSHSLALRSDGSIVGWGSNKDYHGNYSGQATPPSGNDYVAISAGGFHGLAIIAGITTRTTVLSMDNPQSVQYSDPLGITATLTDESTGDPVPDKTVSFGLGGVEKTAVTGEDGKASATFGVDEPEGTYPITAEFAGDDQYLPSQASGNIVVIPEDATLNYTGDYLRSITQSVSLSATLDEQADNSYGDITKASPVVFEIWNSQAMVREVSANVTEVSPGHGQAVASTGPLPADIYTVKVRLADNGYYEAADVSAQLAVYNPSGGFVTGGGFIVKNGAKNNFGFNVKYSGLGPLFPSGELNYIDRSINGRPLKIDATTFTYLVIPDGNYTAYVTGTCTFDGQSGYSFQMVVQDAGNQGQDSLQILVQDPQGNVVYDASGPLGGGNIKIHG